MNNLYEFFWDCGRQGEIDGRFLATPDEVKCIVGKKINFGEVLGKHSEVFGTIDEGDIQLVTDNKDFLSIASSINIDLNTGLNPFDYYTCDRCGSSKDVVSGECEDKYCIEDDEG